MKMIDVTVKEFGEIQGLKSQSEANSVINLLKSKGIVKRVGNRKRSDGRGKPAAIYRIPQTVTLSLFEDEQT